MADARVPERLPSSGEALGTDEKPWSADGELVLLVYRQMRSLAGPRADLDDLVQSALEQILLARFEGRAQFSTFTHAICYRVWMKQLRSLYRFRTLFSLRVPDEPYEPIDPSTPQELAEATERLQNFYRVLAGLSPKRRAVVVLHDIGGEDVPSIASIVGTSEATVRTRLRDGRKRLRELLVRDAYFARESLDSGEQQEVRSRELREGRPV